MINNSCGHGEADYQITIRGRIGEQWSDWFGGAEVKFKNGKTTLNIDALDQAALHALLGRLYSLGIPLIAVERINQDDDNG